MEVINESAALLTNYEVYSLLTDIQNGRGQKKPNKHQQNLATITYETVKYLENTPCKLQDPDILAKFTKAVAPFKLMKAETLQLLNHRPKTAVEIQLIIEESEERLTEEQIYELLEIISTNVPGTDEVETTEMAEVEMNNEEIREDTEMEAEDDYDEDEEVEVADELIVEDKNDVQVGEEDNDDD
ncbi:hypothetical protein SNE40_004830 [Patella caerulea]|uniref:DNA-directed RNA polymerase III subunit RPC9 n=1 Tax=Patella caerulea TaxID=87958 RepID=A0AAN8K3R1_PATCE